MNPQTDFPRVVALAVRTAPRGPMRELDDVLAEEGAGLQGHGRVSNKRGVTLLSREQWDDVCRELGHDLPWHTRRANVLVEGVALGPLIGRRLRIGEVEVEVVAETEPCPRMDEAWPGLRAVLEPDCRGGVHGQIVRGGVIRVGAALEVLESR
jgi:MOSC domain-containing protein YiiM